MIEQIAAKVQRLEGKRVTLLDSGPRTLDSPRPGKGAAIDLYEVIDQVAALLQQRGRLAYQALKYQFKLDDDGLEALKAELIDGQRVAVDDAGKVLVWTSAAPVSGSTSQVSGSQPLTSGLRTAAPGRWTPPHLAERIRAEQAAMAARGSTDGERKTITALFADLKGSTALIEDLDPEDARHLIDLALQLMMDAVHRYEGYVAQSLGDGIFALFGAPIAHENHPQRAGSRRSRWSYAQ